MAIGGDLWNAREKNGEEFWKRSQTKERLKRFKFSLGGQELQFVNLCHRDSETKIEFAIEIEVLSLY